MQLGQNIKEANQEFLNLFGIDNNSSFTNPVLFDTDFGFSLKRKYDAKVLKLLPEPKEGDEYIALFHVFVENEELQKDDTLKTVGIRASMVVGKDKLLFPKTKNLRSPVDIVSDDYQLNFADNKFYKNGTGISPSQMLQEVYEIHVKPSRTFKGSIFRTKKLSFIASSKSIICLAQLLVLINRILTDKNYTWNADRRAMENEYPKFFKKEDVEVVEPEKVKFLGFEVSRWSLFTYCFIHLAIYLFFKHSPHLSFMKSILSNPFLTIVYAFVSLSIYEKYFPLVIGWLITKLTVIGFRIKNMPIKI